MADDTSARLALPLLQSGQAQKEVTHNEALALLDLAVQAGVAAVGVNAPPDAPAPGACWIVGTTPTGAWAGHAAALAGWTDGGWRFVAATEGMAVWSVADVMAARYVGGAWTVGGLVGHALQIDGLRVVGPRADPIVAPAGGTVIDSEGRAAIGMILDALKAHGLIG